MKNTILIFILVTMSQVTIAQIQKGAGYFGGQLSGYSNNGENPQTSLTSEYENSNWNFNISYGHYLTDNFAIGLGAGIGLSDFKEDNAGPNYHNTYEQDATMYYFTPFVRFSKKITDNFYCYGNFQIQIGNGTTDYTYTSLNSGETTSKSSVSNLGGALTGGLNYFLNRHFAFSLTYGNLSYTSTTTDTEFQSGDSDKSDADAINLNLGLSSIGIGLQYFINNGTDKK